MMLKRVSLKPARVLAGAIALATVLPVAAGDGFYAGVLGGWNKVARQDFRVFGNEPTETNDTLVTSSHYDDGGLYGGVLGWTFNPRLNWGLFSFAVRPEVEYTMRLNDLEVSNDVQTGFSDDAGHIRYKSVIPNLWFDFNANGRLKPYFGGGYGWGEIYVNDLNYQGTRSASNGQHEDGDVFQVGAGLAFDVTSKLTMSLDWRHQNSEVFRLNFVDNSPTRTINEDYRSEALVFTARYAFFHRDPAPPAPPPPPPAPVQVVQPTGPVDSDGDGIPDDLDKCPDTPPGVKVDENGCPLPECKDPVPGQPVNLEGCAEGDVIILRGVTFEFDKVTLTKEAEVVLDEVGKALNRSRVIEVELRGHTDSIGSDAYNQSLSEGRSLSVKNYLANLGVDPGRMTPLGFGESQPIADNSTEEGRALNRRVELKVVSGRALVAPIETTVGSDVGASEPARIKKKK